VNVRLCYAALGDVNKPNHPEGSFLKNLKSLNGLLIHISLSYLLCNIREYIREIRPTSKA
jgi:hypothetical protein